MSRAREAGDGKEGAGAGQGLRVAYDIAPLLDPPTGVARYARELAGSLELRGVELTRYAVSLRGGRDSSAARWRVPARIAQMAWRRFGEPHIERLVANVEIVHATNFVLPALRRARGVVTVHDLSFFREDVFPGGDRLRTLVPWSVRRAAKLLVPTKAVADEAAQRFGCPLEKIHVTHEGVSAAFFGATPLGTKVLERMGIPGPFIVGAGALEPRKNWHRLLEAWRLAADELKGWTLVLAGPKGWGRDLPRAEGVVLTGWVGDETLPGLFAAADVFCYPSLYEGFGLPPLEAMAAGTPTLVGNYPCAKEVVGDGALIVDALSVEGIKEGLLHLAGDASLRRRLALAGKARASKYTWEQTSAATIKAYRAALED